MNELEARAILFSVIEGGQAFWSSEISTKGALAVYEKLLHGGRCEYACHCQYCIKQQQEQQ